MGIFKIKILRVLTIETLSLIAKLNIRISLPCYWLCHYLKGSGKDLEVPSWVFKEAEESIARSIMLNDGVYNYGDSGLYCLNHSTVYDGYGFNGRPRLFYLVGGFHFKYYETTRRVLGRDVYDWHPTRPGEYFTSPLGKGYLIRALVWLAALLFGADYFVQEGFCTRDASISNKLWEDMELVGAKPFTSIIKGTLSKEVLESTYRDIWEESGTYWENKTYWVPQIGFIDFSATLGTEPEDFMALRPWLQVNCESFENLDNSQFNLFPEGDEDDR